MSHLIDRAALLVDIKRYDQAVELLLKELSENPANVGAKAYLGIVYGYMKKFDLGNEAADNAIHESPDYFYCHYAKAYLLSMQRKWNECIECCHEALRLNPQDADCFCLIAHCEFRLDHFEESLKAARDGLEIEPQNVICIDNEAWALVELDKMDEARDSIRRGLELSPEYANLHACAAYLDQKLCNFDAAAASYQRAMTLDPNEAWTKGRLHYTLGIQNSLMYRWAKFFARWKYSVGFWYFAIQMTIVVVTLVAVATFLYTVVN